jgi:hypothetical protein
MTILVAISMVRLQNPKDNYDTACEFFLAQFNGFMSLTSYFDVTYIINITETTYSCQF